MKKQLKLFAILVCASMLLVTANNVYRVRAEDTSSLIYRLTTFMNEVDWNESIDSIYNGYIIGTKSLADIQTAFDSLNTTVDILSALNILQWAAILEKLGIVNETKIKWALDNVTMMANGLPVTAPTHYNVYYRGFLYAGFYYAEKYGYETSKWNKTKAYENYKWAVEHSTYPAVLIVYDDNTTYVGSAFGPRYYDEAAETMDVFIEFYDLGINTALDDAINVWEWINNNLWVGSYYKYAYTNTGYECEAGEFLEIALKLWHRVGISLENITRTTDDIINRFLISRWASPQWSIGSTEYYVVVHRNPDMDQRMFPQTISAWAALVGSYGRFNDTVKGLVNDMLLGYAGYDPAWKLLMNASGGLYDSGTNKFRWDSNAPTYTATAYASSLMFMLGIVPDTAVLAIPLEEYYYEEITSSLDGGLFRINITSREVYLGITETGSVNFLFNSTVPYTFNSAGIWKVTFNPGWNSISSVTCESVLPTNRDYFASEPVLGVINSVPVGATFYLNGTSRTTPFYKSAIFGGTYNVTFPTTFVSDSGLIWAFSYWEDYSTSNTRMVNFSSSFSITAFYTSEYAPLTYTGFGPVFECAMNNMFELDAISESMIGNVQRQMLLDSSPYANHGHMYPITSPYGGPSLTWGAMGKGLRLDGVDDTVIVPSSYSLNISEAITVEFWFSVDNGTTNQIMISKPNEWHIAVINHTLYAGVYTTGGNYWIESNISLPDGAFIFASLVYDYRYANASLYINSELDSSVATDGLPIAQNNSDLYLGSLNNASYYFKGVLDEIRIFPYERSEQAIYADARAAISKFDCLNFVASSKQAGYGTDLLPTEGVIDGYTGLKTNDWQLPWAYANDTYQMTAIRAASYMAGFQSYQLYCNVKWTSSNAGTSWDRCFVDWYWLFFRDGRLQVAYIMEVSTESVVDGGDVWNVTKWHVRFVRSTSYSTNVTMFDYIFSTNTTLYPNSIPIIVSAWIGPDNTHFTIRFDVQDSRMITAYDGSYVTPFAYSFELVDEDSNPHLLTWFDGWMVSGIKVRANCFWGNWARMEIESHKFFWIPIILVAVLIFGFAMVYYSKPSELLVPVLVPTIVNTVTKEIINVLTPIAEIIAAAVKGIGEPIVDALSLLSHDIIGAVFGLGTVFMQGLAPLGAILQSAGAGFVDALILGMALIWQRFLEVITDGWTQALIFYDEIFAWLGFPGGATTLTGWLGSAWSWMVSSMTYSISLFPMFFTFLGTFMVQLVAFIAEAFQWWGAIFTATGSFLAGGYGTGVNIWTTYNIPQWITLGLILYPIYLVFLWEEEGLGAVIDQITFIYNSLHLMIYVFLTMIHYISSMITRLIELIPIAE